MQRFIEFFEGIEARQFDPEQPGAQRRRLVTGIGEVVEQLSKGVDPKDRRLLLIARAVLFCLKRR